MGATAQAEISSNGSGGGGDDGFYEDIEAPKFVDFTAPDHHNPDDRFWFCSRVGCDQRHEEEIDPDEIYKIFVLRVMAARSPNVKLRKALARKPTNATKCPMSAPPKPSRPRISRLAVLSSISKKLMDGKETAKPIRPVTATPNPIAKKPSIVSNALTTPRNKRRVLKPELFRSVRNTKEATAPVQSTRAIAKALTFQSPKKVVKKTVSSEMDASIRNICTGMKKLEITGQRKNILGYENSTLPSDASKKRLGAREVKSRVFDSLKSQNHKGKEMPSKCTMKKGIGKEAAVCADQAIHDVSSGESSDMEVDSHRGSLEESSAKSELFEVPVVQADLDELTKEVTIQVEKIVTSIEAVVTPNDNEGSREVSENDDKENVSAANNNGEQNEVVENDEKENASAPDYNRDNAERKILFNGTNGKIQKATQKVIKGSKENSGDQRSVQGGKYVKPRPTNPKPFRLRTDERGVLKEANLEKKFLAPLKEMSMAVSGFSAGSLLAKKHQHQLKRNGNVSEKFKDESNLQLREAKTDRMHQDGPKIRSKYSTIERRVVSKDKTTSVVTPLRQSRERIRKAKLHLLKKQSQRTLPSKTATPGNGTESKEDTKLKQKAANSDASRSLSRGKRPLTIPKEPHFHTTQRAALRS